MKTVLIEIFFRGPIVGSAVCSLIVHFALLIPFCSIVFYEASETKRNLQLPVKISRREGEQKNAVAGGKGLGARGRALNGQKNGGISSSPSEIWLNKPPAFESEFGRFFYAKEIDPEKILAGDLFPALDYLEIPPPKILRRAAKSKASIPRLADRVSESASFSVQWAKVPSIFAPLYFPEDLRRRYFDDTISGNNSAQLARFFSRWGNRNPDRGDLPVAARELYFMNLQRVVFDRGEGAEPETAVEYLHEALGKKEILELILSQIRKFYGTKLATELLFIVEDIFHAQKLAIAAVRASLESTVASRETALVRKVMARYRRALRRYDAAELAQRFDQKRLDFLEHILLTTPSGYRAGDAFFLKGLILWNQGCSEKNPEKIGLALGAWNKAVQSDLPGNIFAEVVKELNTLADLRTIAPAYCANANTRAVIQKFETQRLIEKVRREKALLNPTPVAGVPTRHDLGFGRLAE